MDFEKSLDDVIFSYKQHILRLNKIKHNISKGELENQLYHFNNSLNIMTYSLLQEGMKENEKIQKENK